jgi:uncharacterized membrane protein
MTRPVAALLGPILGCIILSISDYASLFVITSIIIAVIGISSGLKIKDIR